MFGGIRCQDLVLKPSGYRTALAQLITGSQTWNWMWIVRTVGCKVCGQLGVKCVEKLVVKCVDNWVHCVRTVGCELCGQLGVRCVDSHV